MIVALAIFETNKVIHNVSPVDQLNVTARVNGKKPNHSDAIQAKSGQAAINIMLGTQRLLKN